MGGELLDVFVFEMVKMCARSYSDLGRNWWCHPLHYTWALCKLTISSVTHWLATYSHLCQFRSNVNIN